MDKETGDPDSTEVEMLKQLASRAAAAPTAASRNMTSFLNHLAQLSTYDKPVSKTVEENPHYDKYKDKIEQMRKTKPQEFKAAVVDVYGDKQKQTTPGQTDMKGSSMMEKMTASSSTVRQKVGGEKERKGLDSVIKLDLLSDKTAVEIADIWNTYHSGKNGIYAVVPKDKFTRLKEKGLECPVFIYALPRGEGYEFFLGQCMGNDWLYTSLIAYQTHGEYAPYSLAVRNYTELAEERGIVLMRGEMASEDLPPELASLLIHQTQLFYGSNENFTLVKTMNTDPDKFKHMDVIDICKKASIF